MEESEGKAGKEESKQLNVYYRPYELQKQIHESNAKYKIACLGRRSGKSKAASAECIKYIQEHYNDERKVQIAWLAPTYQIAERGLDSFKEVLRDLIREGIVEVKGKPPVLTWNGHKVLFLSTDNPNSIRGYWFSLMVIDEAAFVDDDCFFKVLLPTLADQDADLLAISTPNGCAGWFYEFAKKNDKHFEFFNWDSYKNPYISNDVLDRMKTEMPIQSFNQEIMAEFVTDSNALIHNLEECDTKDECKCNSKKIMGLDLARHHDYTVAIAACPICGLVTGLNRYNHIDWDEQVTKILSFYRQYNCGELIFDANSIGDVIGTALKGKNIRLTPYKITSTSKKELVNYLILCCEQKMIRWDFEEYPVIASEIRTYRMETTRTGHVTYNAAPSKFDDAVISLALICTKLASIPKHEPFFMDAGDVVSELDKANSDISEHMQSDIVWTSEAEWDD